MTKSRQLQIRVSAHDKVRLKRLASAAGLDVSAYVLSRALPPAERALHELIDALATESGPTTTLAALNDLLASLSAGEQRQILARVDVGRLAPILQNQVAAMVEQAAAIAGIPAPAWTATVPPLEEPHFASSLGSLRLHLLRASPPAFKRRNLFVDAALGDRV